MKLRNRIFAFLVAMTLTVGLCACEEPPQEAVNTTENDVTEADTPASSTESEPAACEHQYKVKKEIPAKALTDGQATYVCSLCGDSYVDVLKKTGTMRVLALGDSLRTEAMDLLWEIAKNGGVETVVLGRLHAADCSLEAHLKNVTDGTKAYTYSKNENGMWSYAENTDAQTALADEEWDVIVLGQTGDDSGVGGSFIHLSGLLRLLKEEQAQIMWSMNWAYPKLCSRLGFSKYGNDQIAMYEKITATVQATVIINKAVAEVIPTGTAIQNLRTSYLGERMVDSDCGLSDFHGKYAAALTWYAALSGGTLESIDWVPEGISNAAEHADVIKASVEDALKECYRVTESDQPPTEVLKKVTVAYQSFDDGKGAKNTEYVFGDKQGTEDGVKLIWDGKTDTTYCNFYNWRNAGSWTSASFEKATVIHQLVLATIWSPISNIGTQIQASVDDVTWTTLYTISEADGSFAEGEREWKLETLTILVEDPTAYNYIRVYDSVGKGFCFAEVEVYAMVPIETN